HVGFHPNGDAQSVLKPGQWDRLLSGLGQVKNPVVPVQASRYAIKVTRSAPAHARSSSRRSGRAQTRAGPRARDG
ncbi:MAG TPA: hypothetical protein PK530_05070, partial [Anaerolineales bacterium]|nr:hypothetical protein [Anaerolineales bacterium]